MQEVKVLDEFKERTIMFSIICWAATTDPALCADLLDSASRCTTPIGTQSTTNTRLTPEISACCRGKEDEQSNI